MEDADFGSGRAAVELVWVECWPLIVLEIWLGNMDVRWRLSVCGWGDQQYEDGIPICQNLYANLRSNIY